MIRTAKVSNLNREDAKIAKVEKTIKRKVSEEIEAIKEEYKNH